ncbi:MAG: HNH endonuclease signature motif containing protein [Bacilli bacterium]|nr:HNH endonuclease signature motif containing protein [Bacilli bacterium]
MDHLNEFIENITPRTYFLTKSMEVSKINSSGTLWYLKKFLVLYDAIFLSKTVRNHGAMKQIQRNFETYIDSLPKSQQKEAENFFFPANIDIRKNYKTYMDFAGPIEINYYANLERYMSLVDKYYFVYLMNVGGQSGVNAFLRDKIYNSEFEVKNLTSLILEYKKAHPEEQYEVNQIINDYHATLRNERQILFYFGFVHSRTTGAGNDKEFASLTPIGELAIESNSKEFALIWEHQKLKMISQPITVEFPAVKNCLSCDHDKFNINFSPYLTILKCMNQNDGLSPRFYDLILSRTNNYNSEIVINNYDLFNKNLEKVKDKLTQDGVRRDLSAEDFEKEMKKYMLGIRSDFPKDFGDNYLGCIKIGPHNSWEVTDREKLNEMVNLYNEIENYKLRKFHTIFLNSETELKQKYLSTAQNINYQINNKIKINWDLYNISKDKIIMLSLIINDYILYNNFKINELDHNKLTEYSRKHFPNVLKSINLTNKINVFNIIKIVAEHIENRNLSEINYDTEYSLEFDYVNKYSNLNSDDLWNKILDVSVENVIPKLDRTRDSRIIALLNSYYIINFSDKNHFIPCECCGEVTFIKNNDEPYVEFHHLIPFNIADGPDHYENIFAVCPMCHRKIHAIKDSFKRSLYENFNLNNHLKKNIFKRLKSLFDSKILKSYQLEYALSEYIITEDEYENFFN